MNVVNSTANAITKGLWINENNFKTDSDIVERIVKTCKRKFKMAIKRKIIDVIDYPDSSLATFTNMNSLNSHFDDCLSKKLRRIPSKSITFNASNKGVLSGIVTIKKLSFDDDVITKIEEVLEHEFGHAVSSQQRLNYFNQGETFEFYDHIMSNTNYKKDNYFTFKDASLFILQGELDNIESETSEVYEVKSVFKNLKDSSKKNLANATKSLLRILKGAGGLIKTKKIKSV